MISELPDCRPLHRLCSTQAFTAPSKVCRSGLFFSLPWNTLAATKSQRERTFPWPTAKRQKRARSWHRAARKTNRGGVRSATRLENAYDWPSSLPLLFQPFGFSSTQHHKLGNALAFVVFLVRYCFTRFLYEYRSDFQAIRHTLNINRCSVNAGEPQAYSGFYPAPDPPLMSRSAGLVGLWSFRDARRHPAGRRSAGHVNK